MKRLCVTVLAATIAFGVGAWAPAAARVEQDVAFFAKVDAFLGARKGDYIFPRALVSDQVSEALTGPPQEDVRLDDGSSLVFGCRRHSCEEKAAVVVSPAGEVRAIGLIHFGCHVAPRPATLPDTGRPYVDCDISKPRLTLFVKRDGAYGMALVRWAARMTDQTAVRDIVVVG